jgi:[acyl-carrier-protein] S-malonyltransferase
MDQALSEVTIKKPISPIVANYSARPVVEPSDIKDSLVKQIMGRVRWRESIEFLSNRGVKQVYEVGAGKALTGMIKRVNKDISCQNIGSPEDLNKILLREN